MIRNSQQRRLDAVTDARLPGQSRTTEDNKRE
jgi:hypothetical protein